MTGFVEIPTLEQYCSYCGQRCLHPDIGIITSGGLPDGQAFKGNFYAICFRRTWCGDKRYGCGCYDFTSATVVFKSPGEIIEPAPVGQLPEVPAAGILFTPGLLAHSSFCDKRDEYTFFGYHENESLHLSWRELQTIAGNVATIMAELFRTSDSYTSELLCKHLSVLLDHCLRSYRRQFILRGDLQERVVAKSRVLAEEYFMSEHAGKSERQAAEYIRGKFPFSPHYLNDLFCSETGMTLPEYIRTLRVELIKREVCHSNKPFVKIASEMGFSSLQALEYTFQKLTAYSLGAYRRARMWVN